MREPKVGDKIVITEIDGYAIEPTMRTITDIDEDALLMKVDADIKYDEDDATNIVEHDSWMYNDEWRYAVRKGDELVVTRMDRKEVEPTKVVAQEDEAEESLAIEIYPPINNGLRHEELLCLTYDDMDKEIGYFDEWHFAEDFETDIETPTTQSYSEFNASQGGGKTLKDYTGVDITPQTLGFVPKHERVLEGITEDSLAFKENDEDVVNHPSHYNRYKREVMDTLKGVMTPDEYRGYLKGNIIKYNARYRFKNGIEDLRKAEVYQTELIDFEIEMEDE